MPSLPRWSPLPPTPRLIECAERAWRDYFSANGLATPKQARASADISKAFAKRCLTLIPRN